MINCICINDKDKPKKIPQHKWVVKDKEYTIIFALHVQPQNTLAFQLAEINLDKSCAPFEYFCASRFGFALEDLDKLQEFIKECSEISKSIKEVIEHERATDTSKEN